MDGELVRLTGTEWAVLDCLWEASPQTMTQLAHTLAGREGWAKGTTTTVLKRMTEKGLLTCQQGERAKWYAPAVERRAAVVSETRSFLRRICRESVSMLTNAAAEPERLSREEIAALTWDQVQFEDNALTLPDRTVPLAPSAEDCLRERHRLYAQRENNRDNRR